MFLEPGWGFTPAVLAWDGSLREGAAFVEGHPCHILALDAPGPQTAQVRRYRITPVAKDVLGWMRNASALRDLLSFVAVNAEHELLVSTESITWRQELEQLLAKIEIAVRQAESQATIAYLEFRISPGRVRLASGPMVGGA
jgi:hypothetical protein